MDYSALTMTFNYQGKQHILKGVLKDFKLSSSKAVNKYQSDGAQFYMLQMMLEARLSGSRSDGLLLALHLPKDVPMPRHSETF